MFGSSLVGHGLKQDFCLVDDDILLDVGVLLIFELEIVGGEDLYGEVGSADGSAFGDEVGGLGDASCRYVIDVLFVNLSHRYDIFIN